MPDMGAATEIIKKPIGPLPLGAWVAVAAGAYFVAKMLRGGKTSSTTANTTTQGDFPLSNDLPTADYQSQFDMLRASLEAQSVTLNDISGRLPPLPAPTPTPTPTPTTYYSYAGGPPAIQGPETGGLNKLATV